MNGCTKLSDAALPSSSSSSFFFFFLPAVNQHPHKEATVSVL